MKRRSAFNTDLSADVHQREKLGDPLAEISPAAVRSSMPRGHRRSTR